MLVSFRWGETCGFTVFNEMGPESLWDDKVPAVRMQLLQAHVLYSSGMSCALGGVIFIDFQLQLPCFGPSLLACHGDARHHCALKTLMPQGIPKHHYPVESLQRFIGLI